MSLFSKSIINSFKFLFQLICCISENLGFDIFTENNVVGYIQIPTYHRVSAMRLTVTFNNISAISWRSVLLVEETRRLGETYQRATIHLQTLSHNVVSSTHRLSGIRAHSFSVISTDWISSCMCNYHTIMVPFPYYNSMYYIQRENYSFYFFQTSLSFSMTSLNQASSLIYFLTRNVESQSNITINLHVSNVSSWYISLEKRRKATKVLESDATYLVA